MTFEVAWNLAKFSPAYGVDDKTVEVHVLMNVHDNQGSTMHLEEMNDMEFTRFDFRANESVAC